MLKEKLKSLHIGSDFEAFFRYTRKHVDGLETGIGQLDSALLGLAGLVGIQGAPGACKSTLGLQIASHNARNGVPVLVVDRENGRERIRSRLISQMTGVPLALQQKVEKSKLREIYDKIVRLPMLVETSNELSVNYIADLAEAMLEIYKAKKGIVLIDSLQALPRDGEEERQALERWLVSFDQLKLDFGDRLTFMFTSEKSRGRYDSASKEGGKGTGNIEYKCEQLIDMREVEGSITKIITQVVKNRDYPKSGDIHLHKVIDKRTTGFLHLLEEDFSGPEL